MHDENQTPTLTRLQKGNLFLRLAQCVSRPAAGERDIRGCSSRGEEHPPPPEHPSSPSLISLPAAQRGPTAEQPGWERIDAGGSWGCRINPGCSHALHGGSLRTPSLGAKVLSPLPLRYAALPELRAPVQSSAPCGFQRADVPHVSPAPRFSPWHLRFTAAASGRVEGGEHPPRRGDATLGDDPFLAERASQHRGNSTRVTQHWGHTAPGSHSTGVPVLCPGGSTAQPRAWEAAAGSWAEHGGEAEE